MNKHRGGRFLFRSHYPVVFENRSISSDFRHGTLHTEPHRSVLSERPNRRQVGLGIATPPPRIDQAGEGDVEAGEGDVVH